MAQLKKSVDRISAARGLSRAELSSRVGLTEARLEKFLSDPPKRKETILHKLAEELLVPEFAFYADEPEIDVATLPDFRLGHPIEHAYQRPTMRWIELASSVQSFAKGTPFEKGRGLSQVIPTDIRASEAGARFRAALSLTDEQQLGAPDARTLFAIVRSKIETFNAFVFQFSFPVEDGTGFCIADGSFDVIVVNTLKQSPERRLFTLAHEVGHCALGRSGISDSRLTNNDVERWCNHFAVGFLAPPGLALQVARQTIRSKSFVIAELARFAETIKLSLEASVYRLVELGVYHDDAIGAWLKFIEGRNFEPPVRRGGRRVDEWKYKLSRYGHKFAEVFGQARERGQFDPYEIYQLSGIKPKYQADYFKFAPKARPDEAVDDDTGGDDE